MSEPPRWNCYEGQGHPHGSTRHAMQCNDDDDDEDDDHDSPWGAAGER
jgi:hypothetical protein